MSGITAKQLEQISRVVGMLNSVRGIHFQEPGSHVVFTVPSVVDVRDENDGTYIGAIIDNGGFEFHFVGDGEDVSPCMVCGQPIVCIPDGHPVCSEECAKKI